MRSQSYDDLFQVLHFAWLAASEKYEALNTFSRHYRDRLWGLWIFKKWMHGVVVNVERRKKKLTLVVSLCLGKRMAVAEATRADRVINWETMMNRCQKIPVLSL